MASQEDKKRPVALNLTPTRSPSSDSSSSSSSLKPPRTPRFAEATSIHSPIDGKSPFADPPVDRSVTAQPQPADIGFGYIANQRESVAVPMSPKTPLKSALRSPGMAPRKIENPLSPTFREEDMLEKREGKNVKQQARDLRIKARVRMAKFALRGVNFSCSLIILTMLSASFSIFNATRALPDQSTMPSWAKNTDTWPQKVVLAMACVSLLACIIVFLAYCRGGHRRAEKVATYYTMFAIGWFILSMLLWAITAALFQHSKNSSGNKDMWGWSCVDNKRSEVFGDKVDYALVCRLNNWVLICIIIEIVVEVICITLYSVVFYRYYTKRKLTKSMDLRDRARSDLYLAQLRTQTAPNTPGFGPRSPSIRDGPKSPAFSQYAMSPRFPPNTYRSLGDIEESPFTPGGGPEPPRSAFAGAPSGGSSPQSEKAGFRLQAPPSKAPKATPKSANNGALSPRTDRAPTPPAAAAPAAASEPTYEAVPIPGAYADQAVKSPNANQTTFR